MKRTILSLIVALTAVLSVNAQTTFEWGTATWNIESGKVYEDIDDFNKEGIILKYPNPANYALTFLNVIAVNFNVYVDGSTTPVAGSSSAQNGTNVSIQFGFVEGHSYKIVTTSACLAQANLATRVTDTLSVNKDSYTVEFKIKGNELVKTIDVENYMSLSIVDQNWSPTFSVVGIKENLPLLGVTDIKDAKVYALNPDESYNVNYVKYDGWRDADGNFTTYYGGYDSYAGHNATPAVYCIKITEEADTIRYYFYDYWKEYDPNAGSTTGGSTINARRYVETSYHRDTVDWKNDDGTITTYTRSYRIDEGKDYKGSFLIVANKKAIRINATLHFVSEAEYEAIKYPAKSYEGYISTGIASAASPASMMGSSVEAQTVTITPTDEENIVKVKFNGFKIPVMPINISEKTFEVTKTVNNDGSISYYADNINVEFLLGAMTSSFLTTIKGTQASEDSFPTFVFTFAQSSIANAFFAQTEAEAKSAMEAYYTELATSVAAPSVKSSAPSAVYGINGARLTSAKKGLNIISVDGVTKKVLVK